MVELRKNFTVWKWKKNVLVGKFELEKICCWFLYEINKVAVYYIKSLTTGELIW